MSVKEYLASIERELGIAKAEEEKLSGGCKASAARVRNSLLAIGKACSESRKIALEAGKAIPVKKRTPKPKSDDDKSGDESMPDAPVPELKRQDAMSSLQLADAARAAMAAEAASEAAIPAPLTKSRRGRQP